MIPVRLIVAFLLAVAGAGCAPPAGPSPAPAGDATAATKQRVLVALAAVGLQAADALQPYRPPEGRLLAAAPRSVLQATLPDDPSDGFLLIYAFPSAPAARAAASDQATYIASGPGRINFAKDTHFVLRVEDSAVIFFHWSPGASPDARTKSIEDALSTIGTGVPIPG